MSATIVTGLVSIGSGITGSAVDGHEQGCDDHHETEIEEELVDQGHWYLNDGCIE